MATEIESGMVTDSQCFDIKAPGGVTNTQHQQDTPSVPGATTGTGSNTSGSKEKKCEIRVYKKSSLNGKITVYLGKRDFVDHVDYVDPIDGVVLIDRDYVKDKKVFGHVMATFSYGRDDLDVLGLTFRKELFLAFQQIYPDNNRRHYSKSCPYFIEGVSENIKIEDPENEKKPPRPLTKLQERLVKKLGPNAYPFFFELPPLCPASVTLQPGPGDSGKPCGIDYELKAYVASHLTDKPCKRDSIKLAIRKIMYAPSKQGEQPMVEVSKDFMMSPNKLNLEVSLDRELYHHGESIAVNVHVSNNSNRTVKKVKVCVRQFADICLFSTAQYKCTVAEIESEEGCPVGPGGTLSKVYYLKPLLADNKDKRGLALDGQLKHEDTNLASSTLLTDASQRDNLGIVVQYKVRVKLSLGPLGGDISAELPVTLMHPKPEGEDENYSSRTQPIAIGASGSGAEDSGVIGKNTFGANNTNDTIFSRTIVCKCLASASSKSTGPTEQQAEGGRDGFIGVGGDGSNTGDQNELNVDNPSRERLESEKDLIQLDDDNDIIFEEFARMMKLDGDLSCSNKSNEDQFQNYMVNNDTDAATTTAPQPPPTNQQLSTTDDPALNIIEPTATTTNDINPDNDPTNMET